MEQEVDMAQIEKLQRILASLKEKRVLIYGAGSFGKEIYKMMQNYEVPVCAFLDQNAEDTGGIYDLPVYRADQAGLDELKKDSLVLFSIVMDKDQRKEVLEFIRSCGFEETVESQEIRCLFIRPDDIGAEELGEYYVSRKGRIETAAALFEEIRSKKIYETNILAHYTADYADCDGLESPMDEQYFSSDLFERMDYSRFVDCGGYTGDSICRLFQRKEKIEAAAAFEPDLQNFVCLSEVCDRYRDRAGQMILFPCAVSNRTDMAHFNMAYGSGMLDRTGEAPVQTISLDMALKGFAPTFIKMDIEGEEKNALLGALNMISEYRPDLAICVYHHINHIWDIPLLIQSWGLGYHFYLRTYNAFTMETVLYATVRD